MVYDLNGSSELRLADTSLTDGRMANAFLGNHPPT